MYTILEKVELSESDKIQIDRATRTKETSDKEQIRLRIRINNEQRFIQEIKSELRRPRLSNDDKEYWNNLLQHTTQMIEKGKLALNYIKSKEA